MKDQVKEAIYEILAEKYSDIRYDSSKKDLARLLETLMEIFT